MANPKFKNGTWLKKNKGHEKYRVVAIKDEDYILNNHSSISFDDAEEIFTQTTKDKNTYPLNKVRNPYNMGRMYASVEEGSEDVLKKIKSNLRIYVRDFMMYCGCTQEEAMEELKKLLSQAISNMETI